MRQAVGRSQRGQSIIEYLVVVAAVITAIIAIGALVQPKVTTLGTTAVNSLDTADTAITANIGAARQ